MKRDGILVSFFFLSCSNSKIKSLCLLDSSNITNQVFRIDSCLLYFWNDDVVAINDFSYHVLSKRIVRVSYVIGHDDHFYDLSPGRIFVRTAQSY